MPYSQMFNEYRDASYDAAQQQPWDEVDFTTLQPSSNDNFKSFKDTGFYDLTALPTVSQNNPPSPNYSQFLNFESSDVGSYSVPSEDMPQESYFRTSPNSFNAPVQSPGFPLKLDPDLMQHESSLCGLSNGQAGDCSPQRCGPEAACLQLVNLPEIEECNKAPCLTTYATDSKSRNLRKSSRSNSNELAAPPRTKEEREKKLSNKRGHRGSSSEDESAQLRAKQAHSVVERRYRDNLNGKIMQLHSVLSATETTSRLTGMPTQDFFSSREHRGKVRKSDVMTDAMNYVHQSEVEIRHMSDEIGRLNDRVRALEKLVKCEDCTLLKQMVRLQLQQPQA